MLFRIAESLQDRACSATNVEHFSFAPIRQFSVERLKEQSVHRAVPPMRLLDAEHCRVFRRLHLLSLVMEGPRDSREGRFPCILVCTQPDQIVAILPNLRL